MHVHWKGTNDSLFRGNIFGTSVLQFISDIFTLCLRFYTQQEQQMASIAAESSAKGPKLGTVLPSSEVEGLDVKSDRRDRLRKIELKMQQRWKENKTFEMDAPKEYTQADKKKFSPVSF